MAMTNVHPYQLWIQTDELMILNVSHVQFIFVRLCISQQWMCIVNTFTVQKWRCVSTSFHQMPEGYGISYMFQVFLMYMAHVQTNRQFCAFVFVNTYPRSIFFSLCYREPIENITNVLEKYVYSNLLLANL